MWRAGLEALRVTADALDDEPALAAWLQRRIAAS